MRRAAVWKARLFLCLCERTPVHDRGPASSTLLVQLRQSDAFVTIKQKRASTVPFIKEMKQRDSVIMDSSFSSARVDVSAQGLLVRGECI